MSKLDKIQKNDIEQAIVGSRGMISIVGKRLGLSWHTAKKAIDMHELQELIDDENEALLDYTESKLFENIDNNDTTSIIFHLKTRGRGRGYGDKANIDITSGNEKIKNVIIFGGKEIEI